MSGFYKSAQNIGTHWGIATLVRRGNHLKFPLTNHSFQAASISQKLGGSLDHCPVKSSVVSADMERKIIAINGYALLKRLQQLIFFAICVGKGGF